MPTADGASWRGGKRFVTAGQQAWSCIVSGVPILCFCLWLILILLKVYLCPCLWVIPLTFHVAGRLGSSFIFVDKSGEISSMSVKGCGSSILGKGEKESAVLAHHTKILGSNLRIKTENYLSLITISVSFFLLKMWVHNTLWNSILIYILVSVL